jgi:hypothetical protein
MSFGTDCGASTIGLPDGVDRAEEPPGHLA